MGPLPLLPGIVRHGDLNVEPDAARHTLVQILALSSVTSLLLRLCHMTKYFRDKVAGRVTHDTHMGSTLHTRVPYLHPPTVSFSFSLAELFIGVKLTLLS